MDNSLNYNSIVDDFSVQITRDEKNARKQALDNLKKSLFDTDKIWTRLEIFEIWKNVKKSLAKCLTDSAEYCRNLSIELWKNFLNILPEDNENIVHLIPILWRRLSFLEQQEPSEEVRLNYVSLLRIVIAKYKKFLPAYSDALIEILARTVTDNYPEVKRESSACIEELASSVPVQFYSRSENLVKPILANFNHQHWKVRVASVKAIGQVLLHGNSKAIEEVSTPLAQRLFDQSGAVRLAVVEVAGLWFLELRDRYSWWHKLIPLLVTGLHDEIKNIRVRAGELWDAAGKLYLQENENDEKLKDKIDFLTHNPKHYPHHSEKFQRPNLGCRVIIQQNLSKLLGGITRELGDWLVDVRVRTAQLLCVLVLNAEQDVTQHIEKLLPAMYRACNDEDPRVVQNVELAAEYMGYFVLPSIYLPLILPTLDQNLTAGHLQVFAAILKGSESFSLCSELKEIAKLLRIPDIRMTKKRRRQEQLLNCCNSIISVCKKDCECIIDDLFLILFTLFALFQENSSKTYAESLIKYLAEIEEMNANEFYVRSIPIILEDLQKRCQNWTIHCSDLAIFRACFLRMPHATAQNSNLILPILKSTMTKDSDPEVRLNIFILLSEYFISKENDDNHFLKISEIGHPILTDIVIPALVWTAGRTAEAIRTAAVCCLCAFFDTSTKKSLQKISDDKEKSAEHYENLIVEGIKKYSLDEFKKIMPILVTLVDDNAKKTRLYALRAILLVLKVGKKLTVVNEEEIHATYPTVLKRLDDGCDDVRAAAAETLVEIWRDLPKKYDLVFSRSHVDYLYTAAIVHLDDPDTEFQKLMLDSLLELAKVHPQLLVTKIVNCRDNFRNRAGLDKLLNRCHVLLQSSD